MCYQKKGVKIHGLPSSKVGFSTWYMSNEKNPGCLGYTGDYITQLYRDYNRPL